MCPALKGNDEEDRATTKCSERAVKGDVPSKISIATLARYNSENNGANI